TTGWSLFGDGTVFLGSGVVVAGDIYSSNWDGTIPANLASLDSGASAGYYLDSSAGAMQLEGNFWLQGDLVMSSSG
ncbi:MAG: hypothetical protein GWO44_17300, partial [Thermoplasmata archaeon]|nr:hypothetical protein [Thermoplasmata archaeon]NIY04958.1 hypothetical protein [Thermoplasmata archaeon]